MNPEFGCASETSSGGYNPFRWKTVHQLRVHARAKMPGQIVINLVDNVVPVHHHPAKGVYSSTKLIGPGQTLQISAGRGKFVKIEVSKLL